MAEADVWKLEGLRKDLKANYAPPPPPLVFGEEGAKCIHIFRNDKMDR